MKIQKKIWGGGGVGLGGGVFGLGGGGGGQGGCERRGGVLGGGVRFGGVRVDVDEKLKFL